MHDRLKKVTFKVSGSYKIGLGHIRRSAALARQMVRLYPETQISFCCENKDDAVCEYLGPFSLEHLVTDEGSLVNAVLEEGTDLLVMDDLQGHQEATRILKERTPLLKIAGLDYFYYDNPFMDIAVNLFNQNRQVADPAQIFGGKYFEGPHYAIIREEFLSLIGKRQVRRDIQKILITFGGSDLQGHSLSCLSLMKVMGFQGEVDIVIGPFFHDQDKVVELLKDAPFSYKVHENIKQMADLIASADCCFCGGGTTMMEACLLGTPVIVFPQNEQELLFARTFEVPGAVTLACSKDELAEKTRRLMQNADQRMEQSRQASCLVDGRGTQRIAVLLWGELPT